MDLKPGAQPLYLLPLLELPDQQADAGRSCHLSGHDYCRLLRLLLELYQEGLFFPKLCQSVLPEYQMPD